MSFLANVRNLKKFFAFLASPYFFGSVNINVQP